MPPAHSVSKLVAPLSLAIQTVSEVDYLLTLLVVVTGKREQLESVRRVRLAKITKWLQKETSSATQ